MLDPLSSSFSAEEYAARREAVRKRMRVRALDVLLITGPENIYYLTGLNHLGYFAFTALILPLEGVPLLVARSVESGTIGAQCCDVEHIGYADGEDPAEAVTSALSRSKLGLTRVGVEMGSMSLPLRVWESVRNRFPAAAWEDGSGIVEECRYVKSSAEVEYIRRAARASDRAMRAGIQAAGVGVSEREIAADVYKSMILGGSEYPGIPPLIRWTGRIPYEHITWSDRALQPGDGLFVELSGCVQRYHAPLTRVIHVNHVPTDVYAAAEIVLEGLEAIRQALRPGVVTGDGYSAWQDVINRRMSPLNYRRHRCGYMVGIGFPPSWVDGGMLVGISPGGDVQVREGMVFHLFSWLSGVGTGAYVVSDTALVTKNGAEFLTETPREPRAVD